MANNIPFQQMGPTVSITATTANTQGNVVSITAVSPCNQYFVSNPDINYGVFVAYGTTANVTANIPNGGPENVVYIPAYSYKVFTGPQCSSTTTVYARCIATHANAVVYVCPGEGF
jgi:predicted RNA-binding Zn-ribbon protein involved in translation (DUF1610 family)